MTTHRGPPYLSRRQGVLQLGQGSTRVCVVIVLKTELNSKLRAGSGLLRLEQLEEPNATSVPSQQPRGHWRLRPLRSLSAATGYRFRSKCSSVGSRMQNSAPLASLGTTHGVDHVRRGWNGKSTAPIRDSVIRELKIRTLTIRRPRCCAGNQIQNSAPSRLASASATLDQIFRLALLSRVALNCTTHLYEE
jgi:hypothetical protein